MTENGSKNVRKLLWFQYIKIFERNQNFIVLNSLAILFPEKFRTFLDLGHSILWHFCTAPGMQICWHFCFLLESWENFLTFFRCNRQRWCHQLGGPQIRSQYIGMNFHQPTHHWNEVGFRYAWRYSDELITIVLIIF